MNSHAQLLEVLIHSQIFQDYQRAFTEATGLPLSLRPIGSWKPALQGAIGENRFCAMIASQSRTCAGCLQTQEKLCQSQDGGAQSVSCPFGLIEAAVPVRLGSEVIGHLVTGQLLRRPPTVNDFERVAKRIHALGLKWDRQELRAAFLQTRVVSQRVLDSTLRLLAIFAEHLAMKSNEIAMHQPNVEPPVVIRVKEYVARYHEEDITLAGAARAAHTSMFYLCKVFKRATGMCFTEFVSRTRIERAKDLLLRPNLRISEIAYQVGFQSLTHFNRIFKKLVGESPTEYRANLSLPLAA